MSEIKINNIPVITENNGNVELTTGTANIGNNALVVNSSGNVGVGTTSPSNLLHVKGAVANDTQGVIANFDSGNLGVGSGPIVKWTNVFVQAAVTMENTASGASALTFQTMSSSTLSERMRITSSGYVTMPYQPMFSGGRNAGEVTDAIFVMNIADQCNVGNHYNTSTGIFTCPVAGNYLVGFSVMTSGNKSGTGDAFSIRVNSTYNRNHYRTFSNLGHERIDGNVILNCQANDTIDFYARAYTIYGASQTHSYGYIGLLG